MTLRKKTIKNKHRVLWLNPLGHSVYDEPISGYIAQIKQPDTEVTVISYDMPNSPLHLEFRSYEALVVGDTIRMARYGGVDGFDAIVIGCFYDPGIEAAREISGDAIVVAPCQASCQIAANLSNKFSVIVGQYKWIEQMTERVHTYGYGKWLASMRSIDIGVHELQQDCGLTTSRIIEEGRKAIEDDHAEVLILGCTCSFDLYEDIQKELGVPVIDPIVAAYKMAEYLGSLKQQFGWSTSRVWSCMPPSEDEIQSFGLFKSAPPIGNKVVIS